MHPLFANKFSLSLGRQRKRAKINPLTNIFLLPLHLLELRTLFWGVFLKNLYFLTFTPLLIWTRVPKCTPIFLIFKKFYLPTHLFKPGEPFCTPPKRKSFRKQKNPSDLSNRRGKVSLNLVFNFNRQKEKDTANGFFSVSCALIFICKDYW